MNGDGCCSDVMLGLLFMTMWRQMNVGGGGILCIIVPHRVLAPRLHGQKKLTRLFIFWIQCCFRRRCEWGRLFGCYCWRAPAYNNNEIDERPGLCVLCTSSGLSDTPAWIAESDQADSFFGSQRCICRRCERRWLF